jgi:hypothetical protein
MRFFAIVPAVLVLTLAQGAFAASGDAPQVAQAASAPAAEMPDSAKQHVDVQAAAETPEPPKMECHMESDIGSMRMHKICTKVPTEAERIQLRNAFVQGLPNNSIAHPVAGGGH